MLFETLVTKTSVPTEQAFAVVDVLIVLGFALSERPAPPPALLLDVKRLVSAL